MMLLEMAEQGTPKLYPSTKTTIIGLKKKKLPE